MDGSTLGDPALVQFSGVLKWFAAKHGYGFVTCDETGKDALLHQNTLNEFGQTSIAPGCEIKALTRGTSKGTQIVEILELQAEPVSDFLPDGTSEQQDRTYLPARVKWFCKKKQYGFVNVFDDPRDCFLHLNTLAKTGLGMVNIGEALGVELDDGPAGRVVVSVKSWS